MGTKADKIAIALGVSLIAVIVVASIIISNIITHKPESNRVYATQAASADEEYTETETETERVPFETRYVEDSNLEYGTTRVRDEGSDGVKTLTYEVRYKGDTEISREFIKEEITKEPQPKVIAKGTKILWHCVDVTSYDRNPNNDNLCTNSKGEKRYVGDCEAKNLDRDYEDSNRGASYYNPC